MCNCVIDEKYCWLQQCAPVESAISNLYSTTEFQWLRQYSEKGNALIHHETGFCSSILQDVYFLIHVYEYAKIKGLEWGKFYHTTTQATSIIPENKPHAQHELQLHKIKGVTILIPSFHSLSYERLGPWLSSCTK